MRLQIFSDLHADVARPRPITVAPDVDAVIVAGDTNLHTDLVHPDGSGGADIEIWEGFLAATGLTDTCTRLSCPEPGAIDKIAYRSSTSVTLDALTHDFPRERFRTVTGEDLSDHPPLVVRFVWDHAA